MTDRAVVLAGGDSERFGDRDKARACVGDDPMLARVVEAARAATDGPPLVAVRDAERERSYRAVLDDVTFVHDDPARAGPLAGIAAAVDATTDAGDVPDWLFACGCDMPRLSPAAVRWLRAQTSGVEAVVPVVDGRPQPLHAWYEAGALSRALAGAAGDSLGALLDELEPRRVDTDRAPPGLDLARSTTNVNTPEDLPES